MTACRKAYKAKVSVRFYLLKSLNAGYASFPNPLRRKKIRKKFQTRSNLDAFSGFLLLEGFFRIKSLEKTTD